MSLSRRRFGAVLSAAAFAQRAQGLPPRPKLFVLLVAEQFRTEYFDSHPTAFSRLLNGSAFFPNCFLDSVSFTAAGLATIATGAYPSVHGIVAGRWFEKTIVEADAGLLQATTICSQFLAADSRNRVYGSGFDLRTTRILTSAVPTAPTPPNTSDKLQWYASGAVSSVPMRTLDSPALWQASPLGQAAQFTHVREIVVNQKLGRGEGIDLLCVVLNSIGLLTQETGADSPLVADLVAHLDTQIEALLKFLDDTLGENSYQLAFTGAHGAPDYSKLRVAAKDIVAAVEKIAPVEAYIYPYLYLRSGNPEAAAKASGAAGWYTAAGACSHIGLFRRRMENSFHRQRSGDAMLIYKPGVTEDFAGARGISYGSIYNYDARVPLLLYGPQFRSAVIEDRVELTDVAPTLARVLGTAMPSSSVGRVLGEAFAR